MTKTNPRHNAATNNHKARPPPLPPKAPFAATSAPRSLQEHLQMTKPKPAAQRGQSASSIVSAASDSSRDCLRREMNRRRQSLTTSEYNFLQDIAANGTEIEVTLAEKRLQDPSLGFDVTEEPEEEGALKHENEEPPLKIVETIPPRLQDDIPSMDFSIETAADRPPDNPMPRSPLPDQKKRTKIPSAAELYPDNELDYSNQDQNIQPRINPVEDLEQTPLVCNFSSKPQKSLEGALELPVVTQQTMLKDTSNSNYNINSNINNSSNNSVASLPQQTMPSLPQQLQLNRASSYSNPNLMGQLWRAHEKGLALTPQQSSKRILLRREQSLSALSPVRRRAMARRNSSTVSSGKKSLLNSKELMANKQRNHARSSSELPWAQMVGNATTALAVLRNTSTDSSTEDMSSLLLPTDEEIFRRSQQLQKQQDNKQQHSSGQPKLPPPRPFREPHSKEQKDTTPYQQEASKPAALRRMASEGATASTAPQIQRKPSILRRMISDGVTSSQNKSVSFQIDHSIKENGTTTPLYHRADSLPTVPSDLGDSISTFTSEHTHTVSDVLREREESCSSIPSIRHGTPLKEDSSKQSQLPKQFAMHRQQQGTPDSNNTEETAATSSATSKNIWSRRDSTSSVASLNLHRANPIRQDSIASTAEGWQANEEFQSELMYSRRESMSSIASLDLHIAAPIRQESIGSTIVGAEQQQVPDDASAAFRRRDSMTSIASIRKASPVRQESIASNADGMEATEAFRQQFLSSPSTVQATWGRRDSMDSIASLNLHLARPIINRQESIGSTAEGLDAAEAFRQKIASERWGRRDSVTSLISRQESLLSINDSINLNFDDLDTSEAFRERGWARRDSMSSLATLNLHQATPIRQDSVASSTWRRQESMGSVASLNIHKAQPIRSDTMSVDIEILRNQGSAIPEKDSNDSEDDDEATPLAAIQPAKPIRQESIHSTVSGKEAKESLKSQFADKQESLREASTGTTMSSTSEALLPLRQDSCASIPSLRPAHPLRQDSVASTTAGEEAKEELCKQFQRATVCEEWEGTVLPESWEDKKEEDGTFPGYDKNFVKGPVVLSRKNVSRPVMMRHASASEYDEEGMEVAAIEEEDEEPSEEEHSTGEDDAVDKAQLLVLPHHTPNTSEDTAIHKNGNRHFPNSLVSFGVNSSSKSQSSAIDACASFDESKIVDRYRGVFRGELPRSLSEDELPLLLSSHCKPKPLARGQSEATVFPPDMESLSWEMDTAAGDYDGWDVLQDEYAVGYGYHSLPFHILGTGADDLKAQPHVLSPPLMESLQSFFPTPKTSDNFWLKYSLVRDGASLHTLMQHARGAKYSILALETTDGEVFGAFTAEPWRKTWSYFGNADSFLWRMRNSRKTPCFSIIDQAQMESEIEVFPFTGANQCIQLCTHNKLAVGGGSPDRSDEEEKRDDTNNADDHDIENVDSGEISIKDHEWGYGLALRGDLTHGTSSPCITFGSPSLSKTHSDGSRFEIINIEIWTLTPCNDVTEAEKLELGKLFLEREQSPVNNASFD